MEQKHKNIKADGEKEKKSFSVDNTLHSASCHCHEHNDGKSVECCCHTEKTAKAEECHCHEHGNDKKSESCCHTEKTAKAEECHCHEHNDDKSVESCCHTEKTVNTEECQCQEHGNDKKTESCCHTEKTVNTEDSHCHEHNDGKSVKSCCHNDKSNKSIISKKTHNDSCSHSSEENASCCNHKSGDGDSCCGTPGKGNEKRALIFMGISLIALIISFIDPFKLHGWFKLLDVAIIAIALCGTPIFISAIRAAKNKKITSGMLISIAMIASIVMGVISIFTEELGHESYFFVAGEIAFLMAIGSYIEDKTAGKSRSAIKNLIALKPTVANLKTADGYQEVDVTKINIGDVVMVKPNEMIGIDGKLVTSYGSVDQANITGESEPVELSKGDKVFAGTKNLNTAIEIEATVKSSETTVSKLIEYVKEAEKNKAPIARIADRFASYVVPGAIIISIIVFLIAQFAFKLDTLIAVQRGITILVVFCPCALALATPTAISAGIGNASKKGVLIKNGEALESLSHITAVAFDKTGTLTEGSLEVERVIPVNLKEEELLQITASAESLSEHPIAKAILKRNKLNLLDVQETKSLIGIGVRAKIENKIIEVVKLQQIANKLSSKDIEKHIGKDTPKTTVAVLIDGKIEGFITLTDIIRKEAKQSLLELKEDGYKTVMLTGDNKNIAKSVADTLGLGDYKYELMPEDKVKAITDYKESKEKVLMVGDGVNDSPALAVADCSLSMGAMGNSIAIDTAKISLMKNDLSKIPFLLRLSKSVIKTIKFNIALSLTISFIAIICSTFGWLNAVTGALVHNASSILVCINSALILSKTFKRKEKGNK